MVYFDYAANTPVDERVLDVFCEYSKTWIGNPNSHHAAGYAAKQKMDEITKEIADVMHVKPSEIIYTSGSSEANNMAVKGIASTCRQKGKHIITTVLEHSSVSGAFTALMNAGYEVDLLDIEPDGTVSLSHLRELLRKDTILVSVGYVDSELGVVQPIDKIGAMLSEYQNCTFHVDATQAVGRIPVELEHVDLCSFAPHKFFGINGCGVLIKKEGVILEPLIHGGASTTIYRSGTPALPLAASIRTALCNALKTMDEHGAYVSSINDEITSRLSAYPLVRINSTSKSIPYIINLSVKGVKAAVMQSELDQRGICVSTKSACSVPNTASRAVYAVTKDKKNALSSFRISLSHLVTKEEIEEFFTQFDDVYKLLTV